MGKISVEDFKLLAAAPEADFSLLSGDKIVETGHMDTNDLANLRLMADKLPTGSTSKGKAKTLASMPVGDTFSSSINDPIKNIKMWVSGTKVEEDTVIGVIMREVASQSVEDKEPRLILTIAKKRGVLSWQGKELVMRIADQLYTFPLRSDVIVQDVPYEMAAIVIPVDVFKELVSKDSWALRIGDDITDTITLNPQKVAALVEARQKLETLDTTKSPEPKDVDVAPFTTP